jgi:hypothetical protein
MKNGAGTDGRFAYLFAAYGLLFSFLVLWRLPPFMGPDELAHLKRADQIASGGLIGERVDLGGRVVAGGRCETSLEQADSYYEPLEFHPERKVDPRAAAAAGELGWGSASAPQAFENTAVYPPFFYLPQAIAIAIGKMLGLTVVRTMLLARAANALACVLVGALAVWLAGRLWPLFFSVLLLPMSVALYSSVTQDGAMIVTAALAAALIGRSLVEGRTMSRAELLGASACLLAVGIAKPPYMLLALALLLARTERPGLRWQAVAAVGALALGWHLLMALKVQTPIYRPDAVIDAGGQARYLLHHPLAVPTVAFKTLAHGGGEYVAQTIGVLGWLDTLLPKPFYGAAIVVLVLAGWLTARSSDGRVSWPLIGLLAVTAVGIFGAFYIAYTPVAAPYVEGVQGRYLLPLAAMLPLAFANGRRESDGGAAWNGVVLAFPAVSFLVTALALWHRYWS